MLSRFRNAGLGLALLCFSASAHAAATPLSAEDIAAAVKIDELSIPTPGELMAALNKLGKLDWPSKFRPAHRDQFPQPPADGSEPRGLIADGYIAVEAQDAQQVKNIGKDIMALAKPLGVQQDIINRGKSLTQFAEENQWDVLREELEATQNEVKNAMEQNQDQKSRHAADGRRLGSGHRGDQRLPRRSLHRGRREARPPAGIIKFPQSAARRAAG
jgi:hypothetical protein